MINSHIPFKLFNSCKKLTREMSINIFNNINRKRVKTIVVDHTLNWKKMPTIKRMVKSNLFLASNLWVKVLYGVNLPKVKLVMFGLHILFDEIIDITNVLNVEF